MEVMYRQASVLLPGRPARYLRGGKAPVLFMCMLLIEVFIAILCVSCT